MSGTAIFSRKTKIYDTFVTTNFLIETLFLQPNQYLRSVDQAGALSLRGPKKIYTASAKREFNGAKTQITQ